MSEAKLEWKTDAGGQGSPSMGIRTSNVGGIGSEHVEVPEPIGGASTDEQ
jgi:hypothetical protein